MTSLDVGTANVFEHSLVDASLVTLDALADAADRLPEQQVEHHVGDLPVILPGGESVRLDQTPGDAVRNVATNGCWVMLRALGVLPEYESLLRRISARYELALRGRGDARASTTSSPSSARPVRPCRCTSTGSIISSFRCRARRLWEPAHSPIPSSCNGRSNEACSRTG